MSQWGALENDSTFLKVASAYGEPHRHYHTAQHIHDCLAKFDAIASAARKPEEVEISLWFHDAVYTPTSAQNELSSARWAASFLQSIGAAPDRCDRVCDYIMATKHDARTRSGDAALVVDIDLSILGREPDQYDIYERAIRQEYQWVPKGVYRQKRIEILQSFRDRPWIYGTEYFRGRYEEQARINLKRAIQRLCQRSLTMRCH